MTSKVAAIFYDLETSDTLFCSQILNYSFIAVDKHFSPLDECSGTVALSRLQIPRVGAILANKIALIDHHATNPPDETTSATKIAEFLTKMAPKRGTRIPFIGYNSHRFDLQFLRTTLIRNGISPYTAALRPLDLYHLIQYLAATEISFPRVPDNDHPDRQSLSLASVSTALGLLHGEQLHESRADVLLTIALSRVLAERWNKDIRTFSPYQGEPFHDTPRSGIVIEGFVPRRDLLSPELAEPRRLTLVEVSEREALWLDLDRYAQGAGRGALLWRPFSKGSMLFASGRRIEDSGLEAAARAALKELDGITLGNFFSPTQCDVEEFIYRIDFDGIDRLHEAINCRSEQPLAELGEKQRFETRRLWARAMLRLLPEETVTKGAWLHSFDRYLSYRYGGSYQVARGEEEEGRDEQRFHPTLATMEEELRLAEEAEQQQGVLSANLLQLREFYASTLPARRYREISQS